MKRRVLSRRRLVVSLRRLVRRKDGAAAVELSLVAIPFFFTMMAMAEISLMSIAQTNLDFAMNETARRIRTGEIQQAGLTAADIKNDVCERMQQVMVVDCLSNLFIDVDRFEAFVEVDSPNPAEDGALEEDEFGFDPGEPSDVILARGFYRWEVLTPFFQTIFANVGSGDRLLTTAILFRNEPFADEEN